MHRAGGRNGQPSPLAIREVATERRLRQKIKNFFTALLAPDETGRTLPGAFPGEMRERRPARLILYLSYLLHISASSGTGAEIVPIGMPSNP